MTKMDHRTSKRAIGVALVLVSMLIMLVCSTMGQPSSANAAASLQGNYNSTFDRNPNAQPILKHTPNGTANLTWDATHERLTVTITISGLAPNSTHPAHIHKGSCETSDNGVIYPLNPVVADKEGKSTSITTIKQPVENGIPMSGWFINVHNGPTLSPDIQKTPIGCGDITNFNTSTTTDQSVDLTLGPTKAPNQAANGVATLSLTNNQLIVTVTVSGLAPRSTHQAHIHQGSCLSQGPVVYPLTPVVADNKGNGTSKTTILNVSSIPTNWYVNVHLAATPADLGTQTGFDPLACGNVVNQ